MSRSINWELMKQETNWSTKTILNNSKAATIKRVTQPVIGGRGANEAKRMSYGKGAELEDFKAKREARYLGPQLEITGEATREIAIKRNEATKVFYSLTRVWKAKHIVFSTKRNIFTTTHYL